MEGIHSYFNESCMAYEESSCFFSFSESAIRWIQSKKSIDEKQWSHQGVSKDIDTEKRLISETVDTLCLVYLYMRPCVCVCVCVCVSGHPTEMGGSDRCDLFRSFIDKKYGRETKKERRKGTERERGRGRGWRGIWFVFFNGLTEGGTGWSPI